MPGRVQCGFVAVITEYRYFHSQQSDEHLLRATRGKLEAYAQAVSPTAHTKCDAVGRTPRQTDVVGRATPVSAVSELQPVPGTADIAGVEEPREIC